MYIVYFLLAFFLSLVLTHFVRVIMTACGILDKPNGKSRKIHRKSIPLGGGWAIFLSFFIVVLLGFSLFKDIGGDISGRKLLGLFAGALIIMIGGLLDDKYNLKARYQLIFPVIAIILVIAFGMGPHVISHPLGGLIKLDQWVIEFGGLGRLVVLADLLLFVWLGAMMFTTKILDGLDGLVAGVVGIGAILIFFLANQKQWFQYEVAILAIILFGACLGFLIWNYHPAKIFLGEGGSLLTGFLLGALAIISGSKIATTLLVMGVPMLDVVRVVAVRIRKGKSIFAGDREHLHYKLLKSGLDHSQAVLLLYAISFTFGAATLFLQGSQKMVALLFLFVLMILLGLWLNKGKRTAN